MVLLNTKNCFERCKHHIAMFCANCCTRSGGNVRKRWFKRGTAQKYRSNHAACTERSLGKYVSSSSPFNAIVVPYALTNSSLPNGAPENCKTTFVQWSIRFPHNRCRCCEVWWAWAHVPPPRTKLPICKSIRHISRRTPCIACNMKLAPLGSHAT